MEDLIILHKNSGGEELRRYFTAVLELSRQDNKFPINLDEVWMLVYSAKEKAVRALKKNFIEGEDFTTLTQKGEGGKFDTIIYHLSVSCMEYFIARKVRPVFEVYRQVFHKVANNEIALPSYQIQDPIERAQKWIEEQKVVKALEEQKHSLEVANSKLKPKADFADAAFKATESFVDIGQASKILSLPFGRNTLFKKLREDGIFFNDKNEPKQKFIDAKYFKVTQLPPIDCGENKPPIIPIKVLVTQKGLAYINMKYNNNQQQTTFKQVIM